MDHKRESQKNNKIKFYNAIQKYGWESFVWEVLYQSKDGEHCLNVMETHFINEFDSMKNGYNTASGGKRGPILPGKLNGMFGKTHTKEVCVKLGKQAKERFGGKSYEEIYGQEKSIELKELRSKQLKGKDNSHKNNPRFDSNIYKFFNMKTGELLECNQWVFYKSGNLSKSSTSEIVNHGISRGDWIVLYS